MFATIALALAFSPPSIIPKPVSMMPGQGDFHFTSSTVISAGRGLTNVANLLRDDLRPATGYELPLTGAGERTIVLNTDSHLADLGPDAYTLNVSPNRIEIKGASPSGVFYGTQTLRQLLPIAIFRRSMASGVDWTVPSVSIKDNPRFSWRGSMMDTSRHFMPKEFILKYIDLLALQKQNVFHFHLTDDQGWRIEIKQYPKLTSVSSDYDFSSMNKGAATRSASQKAGGFYTQDDIREIVRYASDRFVTVVPEIEMPGHAAAAIKAYPELGNVVQINQAGKDGAAIGMDNVYNGEVGTIKFIQNVLDEVMELFPSKFIHVGGDEVWKEPWKQNPQVQAQMTKLGLKTEDEFQSWFIKQMDAYLTSKGRRLIGWDEILEGGLADNAAVMSWRGIEGGITAAKSGHDVVMSPTSHAYLDYGQAKNAAGEPKNIGGYLPIEKVYSFNPVPAGLTPEEAKHILGCQGNLWTEYIPFPKQLEYMAFPRLCALAEVGWTPQADRNWDDFKARLEVYLQRLDILDVHYRPLGEVTQPMVGAWKSGEITTEWATKEWPVKPSAITANGLKVQFQYTEGDSRIDIEKVELLENGQVVATDEHEGHTGNVSNENTYNLKIPGAKPGASYILRVKLKTDGNNDSNGDIYIVPA